MPNESRKIVINILPQSPEAWSYIVGVSFFVACAFGVNAIAGCQARCIETEAQRVRITDNTIISAK